MAKQSEIDEIRLKEESYRNDRLRDTFESKGWKEIIFPELENLFLQNIESSMGESEDSKIARAEMRALTKIVSRIGLQWDKSLKAKEYFNKKLNKGV